MGTKIISTLGTGPISLPVPSKKPQRWLGRLQVKAAAGAAFQFPHYKAQVTRQGALVPQPWSPTQGTPLAQHSLPAAEMPHGSHIQPQQALQQLQLAATSAVIVLRQLEWRQRVQLLWQQLGLAVAAAQAWAQAAWLHAVAMWPVWVTAARAVLADARQALREALRGQGPIAQLPDALQSLGAAWGLQRLPTDVMQQLEQLANVARNADQHKLGRKLQTIASAISNEAVRARMQLHVSTPITRGTSSSTSSNTAASSTGINTSSNQPLKQGAAVALAAASFSAAATQPDRHVGFGFGNWAGKQGATSSSQQMQAPWGEQVDAEPNTDEVWAELMGLSDGADWDSTWQLPAETAQSQQPQQQSQQQQQRQEGHGQLQLAADIATASRAAGSSGRLYETAQAASQRARAQVQLLLMPAMHHASTFLQAHRGPAIVVGVALAFAALVAGVRRWLLAHAEAAEEEAVRQVALQLKAEELAAQRARFKRVLVASEPDRESRKTALLMQQQEELGWESSAAAAESVTASAAGSAAAAAAAAAAVQQRAARDDAAMREWQRFVQRSRMGEVEQLWDVHMADDEPQASVEVLSRMTQQIRDAAKGDEEAESAQRAAEAARREEEQQELQRLRQQQQQQQQALAGAGGLDAGTVQRARERRARAAAAALQQLQQQQEQEVAGKRGRPANPFALSSEERARWDAEEHVFNDPKASKRGRAAASQLLGSSSGSSDRDASSGSDAARVAGGGLQQRSGHAGVDSHAAAVAASGRSSPSGQRMSHDDARNLNPAGGHSPRPASPVAHVAAPAGAAGVPGPLSLTEEQRQEWGDWHEEFAGIGSRAAVRRRRQQSGTSGSSQQAAAASGLVPQPPALVPGRVATPAAAAGAGAAQQQRQQARIVRGRSEWAQMLDLLDAAGRTVARSIGASLTSSRGSSSTGTPQRARPPAAQPQAGAAAGSASAANTAALLAAAGVAGGAQEGASARSMAQVAQELAEEVVGASSLARRVAARDMDSIAAPALPLEVAQRVASPGPGDVAPRAAEQEMQAARQGKDIGAMKAVSAAEGGARVGEEQQRRRVPAHEDVNPFAVSPQEVADDDGDDVWEQREQEVARMQVVLPPVRAALM